MISTAAPAWLGRQLELRAASSELKTARRFARAAAGSFGLDEKESYDFTFAVNEAVSNAVEHGRPSSEGTLRLYVAEEDGGLAFYVEDHGTFVPRAFDLETLPARGRGLAFMTVMVDEVDVRQEETGTVIRLLKRRQGPRLL
jgi:anti-sigma regulatory factor (Ser/Thr protein kinase)